MSTSEFEDNQCWINEGSSAGSMDVEAELSPTTGKIEMDPKRCANWILLGRWKTMMADVPNQSFSSSGFSDPMNPVFDKETGLFIIKPRLLKNPPKLLPCSLRSISDKKINQKAFSQKVLNHSGSKGFTESPKSLSPISTRAEAKVAFSYGVDEKEEELEFEAAKCLEVCNVSGLYFKEVRERFIKMGKRDTSHR
ncbi:hypothetical protein V6N13_051051 [Hibiscus sabdariffa]|uniref:Uncharacterized protein n=1 Tax=Hibiscus sabdariffa TaxID=183260 RepID=A0ABR2T2H7_9ROSI